jgi:hypothetical protein
MLDNESVTLLGALIVLIASIITLVTRIIELQRIGDQQGGETPERRGRILRHFGVIGLSTLVAVISAIIAASIISDEDPNGDPTPTNEPSQPTLTSTSTVAATQTPSADATDEVADQEPQLFDDFNDNIVDTTKWDEVDPANLIQERDGALQLVLQSAVDGSNEGAVRAVTQDSPIRRVVFDLTLVSYTDGLDASAGIDVFIDDSHWVSLKVGPSSEQGAGMEISFCPHPTSDVEIVGLPQYEDCENLGGVELTPGTPVEVELVHTGEAFAVVVEGTTLFERPLGGNAARDFELNIRGVEGSSMQATIDNVRVQYAEEQG